MHIEGNKVRVNSTELKSLLHPVAGKVSTAIQVRARELARQIGENVIIVSWDYDEIITINPNDFLTGVDN